MNWTPSRHAVKATPLLKRYNWLWTKGSDREEDTLPSSSMGLQWRESVASGSLESTSVRTWPGLTTQTASQNHPENGYSSSGGCGGSAWTPGYSSTSTGVPLRVFWLAASLPGMAVAPPCLAHHQDLYTQQCRNKANRIIKDPNHPSHKVFCFVCVPSGRWCRSIQSCTTRLRDSFIPQAVGLLSCRARHYDTLLAWHCHTLPVYYWC